MSYKSENNFPSTFTSSKEKAGKEYILEFAKDVWSQAEDSDGYYSFENDVERFKNNRRYSEGLNSVEKFKERFSADGDSTYLNMNWMVSTPLPKIVEVMRGQMINQPYKAQFRPVDSLSISEIEKKRRSILAKMKAKEVLGQMEKEGVVKISKEKLPDDNDELDVYMSTQFKLGQSIAMESLSQAILNDNNYSQIESKNAKNLIDIKKAGCRVYLDQDKNICIKELDPVNIVSSYVKYDDFSDAKFIGEIQYITIDDLRVQAPELSEKDLFEIAKNASDDWGNGRFPYSDKYYGAYGINPNRYGQFKTKVLDFEFFSTDDLVYVKQEAKNGGYYYQKKSEDYEPPENPRRKRTVKRNKVKNVYCGKWVIGTKHLYHYGKKEHIIRDRMNNKYSTNTRLGFIMYAPDIFDMQNMSKVEEAIPYADALIMIQLKMQQFIAKAAPSGYMMNVDAVVGALQGMGMGKMTPVEVRSMTDQIGDVYYKDRHEDGTPITTGRPVERMPNGLDSSLQILGMEYNMALARMKETLGMNDAVDSSQPDKRAAVGVQKISLAAHKNALRTLYGSYLKINEDVVRYISLLAQQLIRKGINKEKYKNWIGEEAVKLIDMGKLPYYDFAITVEMLPDEEDKQKIEEMLVRSLDAGTIKAADVFAVRRLMNEDVDKAELMLAVVEKRRLKEAQEQAQAQSQMNAEAQAAAAQAAEQAKQLTISAQGEVDKILQDEKYEWEIKLAKTKGEEERKTELVKGDVKEELIETAADMENNPPPNSTSKPPQKRTPENDGGYNLKTDSIPKEAGRIEPSVAPDPSRIALP